MLLGEPQASEYDWRFRLFRFPVRVTWLFWAFSAALGYGQAQSMHYLFTAMGFSTHFAVLLLLWVLSSFVSILVHELGHALAFRYFGVGCEIVLYQMGGVAIPGSGLLWARQGRRARLSHRDQFIISAAGPGIQLLLAAVVAALALAFHLPISLYLEAMSWLGTPFKAPELSQNTAYAFAAADFLVSSSVWWALINLLPVYPLDGGQIARHVIGMVMHRDGLYEANCLGVATGALGAFWFYQNSMPMGAIFFASLAYANLQSLQSGSGGATW